MVSTYGKWGLACHCVIRVQKSIRINATPNVRMSGLTPFLVAPFRERARARARKKDDMDCMDHMDDMDDMVHKYVSLFL
jgi:hypothetical protein